MTTNNSQDIASLREGGRLLAKILERVVEQVKPGVSTNDLNLVAEREIIKVGGKSSFKGYVARTAHKPYPAALCVSVNDEVVHGIPGERVLKSGDIVGLDIGMKYKGFYTDMAVTVPVGRASNEAKRLILVTKKALARAISAVNSGGHIGDIGEAVQKFVEREGFGVVRELVGHGVGCAVHEEPEIPNWGKKGTGPKILEGMVLALEPMVTAGSPRVKVSGDGWAWRTADGSLAAHFEHTILVTKKGAEILTQQ